MALLSRLGMSCRTMALVGTLDRYKENTLDKNSRSKKALLRIIPQNRQNHLITPRNIATKTLKQGLTFRPPVIYIGKDFVTYIFFFILIF